MTDENTFRSGEDAPPPKSESPGRRWNWWLAGRSSRREYWLYLGLLILLSVALSRLPRLPLMANFGLTLALIFVQIRRIHDFGRTGWWAAAATLAPLVALLLVPVVGLDGVMLVALAIEIVLLAVIGAIPGETGDNRFGPPPPVTLKRMLTGR